MSIDLKNEIIVLFSKLPGFCEQRYGKRINRSTAHRWRTRGVRGVKLETVLFGGNRVTSEEALDRFFNRTTAAENGETPLGVLSPSAIAKDEAYLENEGI